MIAAPTAPAMCGRRSVQSRQSRQKWRRVERSVGSSIPNSVKKPGACRRDLSGFVVVEHDVFAGDERIGEINAEAAREVVVADSGRTRARGLDGRAGGIAVSSRERRRRSRRSCRPRSARQAGNSDAAPADHREQARLGQLREMGAGGLRRDSRRTGKLARGQGTAIEKRRHHRGSRRIADQRRDLGDDRARNHLGFPQLPAMRLLGVLDTAFLTRISARSRPLSPAAAGAPQPQLGATGGAAISGGPGRR